jgi:hypothetical protein
VWEVSGHGEGVATFPPGSDPATRAAKQRRAAWHEHRAKTLQAVAAAFRQVARVRKGRWAAEQAVLLEQQAWQSRQYAKKMRAEAEPPKPGRRWEWLHISRGGR